MVHDVIHERFAKHGPEHYRERDRITREKLEKLAPDDPARFPLLDDLGVGLDRLGRSDEAVVIYREKLERQKAAGLAGRDLYTTYANLGTALIHGAFAKASSGDEAAKKRFREGLDFVRESVKVNPEAHFGRERWQVAVAEFLLATMDDPSLLTKYDCLGNRLDRAFEPTSLRGVEVSGYGDGDARRAVGGFFSSQITHERFPDYGFRADPEDPDRWQKFVPLRKWITQIGAETWWSDALRLKLIGWVDVPVPSHRQPVPFDEPMLGLIGMWRQGGGANPHFALAMGETMLRVGQKFIAWSAFERASRMADRYSSVPETRAFLKSHCARRQKEIEALMAERVVAHSWLQDEREPVPQDEIAGLRAAFDDELAYGQGYQREYQAYESAKIAAGDSIESDDFFAKFDADHPTIATIPGPEETLLVVPPDALKRQWSKSMLGHVLFGIGLFCLPTAGLIRLASFFKSRWGPGKVPPSGDEPL